MKILGLHFGHDAGVCVLDTGVIKSCVLRERITRIKHAISLDMRTIELALHQAGLTLAQIDRVAITSTQYIDIIIDDPTRFNLDYKRSTKDAVISTLKESLKKKKINIEGVVSKGFLDIFYDETFHETLMYKSYRHFFPEHISKQRHEIKTFGVITDFWYPKRWQKNILIEDQMHLSAGDFALDEETRLGCHFPATVTIDGLPIPAYIISHHAAHAASSFYNSGFEEAAVFTNDGYGVGDKDLTGLFFWGCGNKLYPLIPHHLVVGHLYEMVGNYIGLGDFGAPGKLMGLAPYGQPRFYRRKFVGNFWDWEKRQVGFDDWWSHLLECGKLRGYDLSSVGCKNHITDRFQVDVAASTQKLFEETCLYATEILSHCLDLLGLKAGNLCMSGGSALNCPTNELIARESPFDRVFVEPGCDDSGLACGAALFTYYNLYNGQRVINPEIPYSPFLGATYTEPHVMDALYSARDRVRWHECSCSAHSAAADLSNNLVVGWFQGRSEIGPRALGARSLLADPREHRNWERVNRIKSREIWRPFAPAVLEEQAELYFKATQFPSPYMLFNAVVKTEGIPAVTHVDRSSRIQTVNQGNGAYYQLIKEFFCLTGVPVILNTSLNGPGEPIVETPVDAIRLFLMTAIDVIYINGFRVTKI